MKLQAKYRTTARVRNTTYTGLIVLLTVCLAIASARSRAQSGTPALGSAGQNINDVLKNLLDADTDRAVQIAPMTKPGDPTPGSFTDVNGGIFDSIFNRIGIQAGKTDPADVQNKDGFLEYIDGENSQVLNPGGTRATFGYFIRYSKTEWVSHWKPEYFVLFSYDKFGSTAATELFVFGPLLRAEDGKTYIDPSQEGSPQPPKLVFGLAVGADGRLLSEVPTNLAGVSNFPDFAGKPEHKNESVKPGVSQNKSGCLLCHSRTDKFPQSTSPFPWVGITSSTGQTTAGNTGDSAAGQPGSASPGGGSKSTTDQPSAQQSQTSQPGSTAPNRTSDAPGQTSGQQQGTPSTTPAPATSSSKTPKQIAKDTGLPDVTGSGKTYSHLSYSDRYGRYEPSDPYGRDFIQPLSGKYYEVYLIYGVDVYVTPGMSWEVKSDGTVVFGDPNTHNTTVVTKDPDGTVTITTATNGRTESTSVTPPPLRNITSQGGVSQGVTPDGQIYLHNLKDGPSVYYQVSRAGQVHWYLLTKGPDGKQTLEPAHLATGPDGKYVLQADAASLPVPPVTPAPPTPQQPQPATPKTQNAKTDSGSAQPAAKPDDVQSRNVMSSDTTTATSSSMTPANIVLIDQPGGPALAPANGTDQGGASGNTTPTTGGSGPQSNTTAPDEVVRKLGPNSLLVYGQEIGLTALYGWKVLPEGTVNVYGIEGDSVSAYWHSINISKNPDGSVVIEDSSSDYYRRSGTYTTTTTINGPRTDTISSSGNHSIRIQGTNGSLTISILDPEKAQQVAKSSGAHVFVVTEMTKQPNGSSTGEFHTVVVPDSPFTSLNQQVQATIDDYTHRNPAAATTNNTAGNPSASKSSVPNEPAPPGEPGSALANGTGQEGAVPGNNPPAAGGATRSPEQTAPITAEEQSLIAGLGGSVSGTLEVQQAPGNVSGVYVFGHWVSIGGTGVGDKVTFTVGSSYVSFTKTSNNGQQTSAVVSQNPDGSLRVVQDIAKPDGKVSSYTQTVTDSQTITNWADGVETISVKTPNGSLLIYVGPPQQNGVRTYDYTYVDNNRNVSTSGTASLAADETLNVNTIMNKVNPPTLTVPVVPEAPNANDSGARDTQKKATKPDASGANTQSSNTTRSNRGGTTVASTPSAAGIETSNIHVFIPTTQDSGKYSVALRNEEHPVQVADADQAAPQVSPQTNPAQQHGPQPPAGSRGSSNAASAAEAGTGNAANKANKENVSTLPMQSGAAAGGKGPAGKGTISGGGSSTGEPEIPPPPPVPEAPNLTPANGLPLLPRKPLPTCWPAGTDIKAACKAWLDIAEHDDVAAKLAREALANSESDLNQAARLDASAAQWDEHSQKLAAYSAMYAADADTYNQKAAAASTDQFAAQWQQLAADAAQQSKDLSAQSAADAAQAAKIRQEATDLRAKVEAAKADEAAKKAAAAAAWADYQACLSLPVCPPEQNLLGVIGGGNPSGNPTGGPTVNGGSGQNIVGEGGSGGLGAILGLMGGLPGLNALNSALFGNSPGAPAVQNIVITVNVNATSESPAAAAAINSSLLHGVPRRISSRGSQTAPHARARFKLAAYHFGSPSRAPSLDRRTTDPSSSKFSSALPPAEGLAFSIVSTGTLGTNALEFRVHDPSGKLKGNIALPEGIVLEPLKPGTQNPVDTVGRNTLAQQLTAYCLDMAKLPPEPGQLYRLAPPAVQQKYLPIKAVLEAGSKLAAAGQFHPDSEPKAYADFVRQQALWAELEKWTEQKFTEVFLERTKKNAEHMNVKWTKEMEKTLLAAAPGRWRDIAMVLDEAYKLGASRRAP